MLKCWKHSANHLFWKIFWKSYSSCDHINFVNQNEQKSKNSIRFLPIFLATVVCNLFGQISVSVFNLLPKFVYCSDEMFWKPTVLFFLFQNVITNASGLKTWNQPLLFEFFLKKLFIMRSFFWSSVNGNIETLFAFFKCFLDRVACNLFGHISISVFHLLPKFEDCSYGIYLKATVLHFIFQIVITNASGMKT